MKKIIILIAVLVLVLNVDATDISDCATLNSANTVYYLTADIINSTAASGCMQFSADNVTLDCQGHIVGGYPPYYSSSCGSGSVIGVISNIAGIDSYVKNCYFKYWCVGFLTNGVNQIIYVDNTTVETCGCNTADSAIRLYYSTNTVYVNNSVFKNVTELFRDAYPGPCNITNSYFYNVHGRIHTTGYLYDNYIDNDSTFTYYASSNYHFNISETEEENIMNGSWTGGNYWEAYSYNCTDSGQDGFCDDPYKWHTTVPYQYDYLPISEYGLGGESNNAPVISNSSPANNSYIAPVYQVILNVTVTDADENDTMNVTIWRGDGAGCDFYDVANNTALDCQWNKIGNFQAGETYNWSVNVTDGTDTTIETYFFSVPWLNCTMNESAPEVECWVDGIPPIGTYGYTLLRYTDTVTELYGWSVLANTSHYTVDTSDGLDYGQTYRFETEWDDCSVFGNNHIFTLYQCYENATPTGCEEGYYCDNHTCVFNDSMNYTSENDTYTLTITDLTNVSAGYTAQIVAQYMNGSAPIEGASCYYTSNGFTLALDNLNEDASHYYSSYVIIADVSGNKSYIVTCSKDGYPSLQAVDNFTIIGEGGASPTEIVWVTAPIETTLYTTESFQVSYETTTGQGIEGASCNFHLGLATNVMGENGEGLYTITYKFNHIATYPYYAVCSKTGYETATTTTKYITVYTETYNATTTTTTLTTPPYDTSSWNCTDMDQKCLEGDIFHCIMCPFYLAMGAWFFVIIWVATCAILYITTETAAAPSFVSIVIGASYYSFLPQEAQIATGLALVVGITGVIYVLIKS